MEKKHVGSLQKGLVFVLSAPAGTGKTTLIKMLQDEFSYVASNVSYTTRHPRPGEVNGVDYHFISEKEFLAKMAKGDFLEHAKVFDHYYGTTKSSIEKLQEEGKHVFLVIDTQGAMQIKKKIQAIFIFVFPPSMEELRTRLGKRQTETEDSMHKRISWAEEEMKMSKNYDYVIVNEKLETAYQSLRSILIAENHRVRM